mgnify:CR=1 FL=1
MEYRIEKDTMGEVKVPSTRYWGAQTERSLNNFKIGPAASMPLEIVHAFAYLKKAAAHTNAELGVLDSAKKELISEVCDEIIKGVHDEEFPLVVWQTGSGTQSNMNCNEVIANRGHVLQGGALTDTEKVLNPNDDVNKSQSSNDTFPTAMHIAAYKKVVETTLPGIKNLREALNRKAQDFQGVVKTGRTHFMDATPLTLGQEFSGYVAQLDHAERAIKNALVAKSNMHLFFTGDDSAFSEVEPEFTEDDYDKYDEHSEKYHENELDMAMSVGGERLFDTEVINSADELMFSWQLPDDKELSVEQVHFNIWSEEGETLSVLLETSANSLKWSDILAKAEQSFELLEKEYYYWEIELNVGTASEPKWLYADDEFYLGTVDMHIESLFSPDGDRLFSNPIKDEPSTEYMQFFVASFPTALTTLSSLGSSDSMCL